MWMLSFVPDAILVHVVNGILILGAVLTFLSYFVVNRVLRWFPPMAPYLTFIQILSAVILLSGVYFKGGYQTEADWRAKVAEVEARVEKAEAASKEANTQLAKKSASKVKVIKERGTIVRQFIDREVVKYDDSCKIPDVVVKAHNAAAKNEDIK